MSGDFLFYSSTRIMLARLPIAELLVGVDASMNADSSTQKILRAGEEFGLKVSETDGTIGVPLLPPTGRMVIFEYTTNQGRQSKILLPRHCFDVVFNFRVGQEVIYSKSANGKMINGRDPEYRAQLYNEEARKFGLNLNESTGIIVEVFPDDRIIKVEFDRGVQFELPHECFVEVLPMTEGNIPEN